MPMLAKKSIVTTTANAALVLVMMTTVTQAQPVEISNAGIDQPPVISVLSDAYAAKWFKFQHLIRDWQVERGVSSSITEMSIRPAYQHIIGMGEDAVPLIIAQLRAEGDDPDQWFWALKAITQVDPVKPEDRGDFAKMAEAWIQWAEDEGYAG